MQYRCLHTRGFTVALINCRLEESLAPLEEPPVGAPQRKRTTTKCGMAVFSAGLSAPMNLYDLDSGQCVGRVGIPDEVVSSVVPQSFCDPDDTLELDLVKKESNP